MNLKQLEVFIAVAESGSFSRAAETTFLTQSTVSQHILSLENEFALKFFDRTGKGALLTEAGKLLLRQARRVTAETREITVVMNRFKGLEEIVLTLGGSNIPGSYLIPEYIPLIRRLYPGVTIALFQGDSRETLARLQSEEVELAIVGARYEGEDFIYEPLYVDTISLVVNAGHRWSGSGNIMLDDLAGETFIFREPGSGTDRTVRQALTAAGFASERLRVGAYLGSNEAVKQAILSGAGIAFLSEMSVRKECELGHLQLVNVEGLEIARNIYLVSRRGRELSPAAQAFSALVTQGGNFN